MTEELLPWYNSELAWIRQSGDEFANTYPKIAGRLRLNSSASDDPHVERLIESFAFLTARIRRKLDDDFPEISESMLEVLHPNYLAPVPPLSVTQFSLDSTAGKLTTGYEVARHSKLEAETEGGTTCRFRTCYPVTLWPIELQHAAINGPPFFAPELPRSNEARSVLELRFTSLNQKLPLNKLGIGSLRFFLNGQKHYVHELYEMLFNNVIEIAVARDASDPNPQRLLTDDLAQVGFAPGEELLPPSARTPRMYQLLREYFAYPEKFNFVDITGLDRALASFGEGGFSLFVYFDCRKESLERYVSTDVFRMGCTPIVNLFEQTAEPIRLTHEKTEYQVVPDARHPTGTEVFSIDRVTAVDGDGKTTDVPPMYSTRHSESDGGATRFWTARRRQGRFRENKSDNGTDLFLSIADLDLNPGDRSDVVLQIETTCLNRDAVSQLPFGGGKPQMRLEKTGPVGRIECLLHPTPARRPTANRGMMWRLISHLSLNHLSVTDEANGAETLQELLRVYDFVRNADEPFPFDGIISVGNSRVVSRVSTQHDDLSVQTASAFARGMEVRLELDEERFVGTGLFLFASVMERFLALQCSVNSFSQLVLRTKQRKDVKRWTPRSGVRQMR